MTEMDREFRRRLLKLYAKVKAENDNESLVCVVPCSEYERNPNRYDNLGDIDIYVTTEESDCVRILPYSRMEQHINQSKNDVKIKGENDL